MQGGAGRGCDDWTYIKCTTSCARSLISRHEGVIDLTLSEMGRNSHLCGQLLHCCYVNGNGFEAFRLLTARPDWELVAHVWPPRSQESTWFPTATDIHDHRWDLASLVVVGRLEMRLHEMIDGSSHLHYEHRRDDSWGHSFTMLRRSGVRPTDELVVEEGTMYALTNTTLHEVRVAPRTTTVTVMLRSLDRRSATNVLTRTPKRTTAIIRQPRLPMTYVRQRLELIASMLDEADSSSTAICR